MKLTAKYNLKKGIVMGLLAALPMFNACEKPDPAPEPTPVTPTPVTPTETYNVEYIYNQTLKFHRVDDTALISSSAFIDTVAKHGADKHINKIYIRPDHDNMWSTAQEAHVAQMESRMNKLRNMYISSNSKLSGENTTLILDSVILHNSNVQNVLHDTLRINLVQNQY